MAGTGVIRHLRNYASAGLLSAVVGVVSFPILTRRLSVEEYGILGLIVSSLTLFVAVGKLGVQQSVIRFFSQVRHGNSEFTPRELNATAAFVFLACAIVTTVLWLLSGTLLLPRLLRYEGIPGLFVAASGVVFLRLLASGVINFLRAEQRSADVARVQVLARLANLALIVGLLLFGDLNPYALLFCLFVAELLASAYAAARYREGFRFGLADFRGPLARLLLTYGLPLMLLESLGLVLRLSDRYLIEALMGVEALGQYSASYNLVGYLDSIVLAALVQALRPAYLQIWEGEGLEGTRAFLHRGLRTYLVLGLPFVAVFSLVSPHLLGLLAGAKYLPGTVVIPWVTLSFLLEGTMQFLAAGLYIAKDSRALMSWGAIAALCNLGLNLLLIPRFGLVGAAVVTILSYAVFMVGIGITSFRKLSYPIPVRVPALMGLSSALVWFALHDLELGSPLADAAFKGSVATLALLACLLAFDPLGRRRLHALVVRTPATDSGDRS